MVGIKLEGREGNKFNVGFVSQKTIMEIAKPVSRRGPSFIV